MRVSVQTALRAAIYDMSVIVATTLHIIFFKKCSVLCFYLASLEQLVLF